MATQPQVLLKDADPVNLVATLSLASGGHRNRSERHGSRGDRVSAEAAAAPDFDAPAVGAHVLRGAARTTTLRASR